MPRILSPAAAQSALAQQTAEVWVACLTIEGDGLETIRICTDSLPLDRAAGTFNPWPFEVTLPEDVERSTGQMQVRVCNVDREVTRLLREYEGVPTAALEVVLASQPDTVEVGPLEFVVLSADIDASTITLQAGYEESLLNQRVPCQNYTPSNSQGLWP